MKIIQVHNYYQQAGGEDGVVAVELELLLASGHAVVTYYKNNEAVGIGLWALVKASVRTLWNWETYAEFRKLLQTEKPDIVHCHNTFPLISPSIYWACAKEGIPVVQTLHNYRLLCLNAFLFRQSNSVKCEDLSVQHDRTTADSGQPSAHSPAPSAQRPVPGPIGAICELCIRKRFKWPGIKYGCYRDSKAGSLVVALMLLLHKLIGTWSKKVTAYIALTEFQKQKMIEGGIPAGKIFVKPNFIQTTEYTDDTEEIIATKDRIGTQGENDFNELNDIQRLTRDTPYALFVGRLSPEKGCDVLIRAWGKYQDRQTASSLQPTASDPSSTNNYQSSTKDQTPQLLIVGDGPERTSLEALASTLMPNANCLMPESITFLGQQPKESVLSLMHNAQFLILPSVWYEGFPMTIVEAFSCAIPVVASNDGGMAAVIKDRETGLLFTLGDVSNLAEKLIWAYSNLDQMAEMGCNAAEASKDLYAPYVNYQQLTMIYDRVVSGGANA